ncbi:MAG: hypothetical protein ACI4TK_00785 [Agathobacter sp.]
MIDGECDVLLGSENRAKKILIRRSAGTTVRENGCAVADGGILLKADAPRVADRTDGEVVTAIKKAATT